MAAKKDSVTVRVLCGEWIEGVFYAPDSVVTFPAAIAANLKASGAVDDHKSAVDYCLSQGAKVVEHK